MNGSGLTPRDLLRTGGAGLRTRPLRAILSGLGICIGVAAIAGVLGISQSAKTALLAEIGQLGNLLTVSPGQTFTNQQAYLSPQAAAMIGMIGPVERTSATAVLPGVTVRRSAAIPLYQTGAIQVQAADTSLAATLSVPVASGAFLNPATSQYPAVVLGHAAALTLGVPSAAGGPQVFIGGHYYTVTGILGPAPLTSAIDDSVFIGAPIARAMFGYTGNPTTIYVRTDPAQVTQVQSVLAATADPASPQNADVTRPADTLTAQLTAKNAFTSLFIGLGAVALLVGGVGIANVMVIGVLERRTEIGLRRALGATRRHIAAQFLIEALLLAGIGGVAGTVLGLAVTLGYAATQHTGLGIPAAASYGGMLAALCIGGLAGLYPAVRAARLPPTEALRTN